MLGMKFMGVCAIVPVTIFLTIGLFVQIAVRKIDSKGLRRYGLVILGLLWFCAVLYFSMGVISMCKDKCPMMYKTDRMHRMMK